MYIKTIVVVSALLMVPLMSFGVWQFAQGEQGVSPCTGAVVPVEDIAPCVVDTHDFDAGAIRYYYPDEASVITSSLNVATVERSMLEFMVDAAPPPFGPFYKTSFYFTDAVSEEAFWVLFADVTKATLHDREVLVGTTANFPDAEYPFAQAYYLTNGAVDTIVVVAGNDRESLAEAITLFEDGVTWVE